MTDEFYKDLIILSTGHIFTFKYNLSIGIIYKYFYYIL